MTKRITLVVSDDQNLDSRWCLSPPVVLDVEGNPIDFVKSVNVEFSITTPSKGVMKQFVRADDESIHPSLLEVETEVEVSVTTASRFYGSSDD